MKALFEKLVSSATETSSLMLRSLISSALLVSPGLAQIPTIDAMAVPDFGVVRTAPTPRSESISAAFDLLAWTTTIALDVDALRAEDDRASGGPLRYGVVQSLALDSRRDGIWLPLQSGGSIWLARIRATGAKSLRIGVQDWSPPPGAELLVFSPDDKRQCHGPYTDGFPTSLWTHRVYGETVHVEYYLPQGLEPGAADSGIVIDAVANEYREFEAQSGAASGALGCHQDPTCNTAANFHGKGVCALSWVDFPYSFYCSGALLNRTASDATPLVMTATHCGVDSRNADSLLVTWFYATTVCDDPSSVPDPATLPQTLGSKVLVRNVETDWTLVGMRGEWPVSGTVLLGWDASFWTIDGLLGEYSVGIHHPRGDYRRWSEGFTFRRFGSRPDPNGGQQCISGTAYEVIYGGWGMVEPGSSGSPLFDDTWHVRGTLSCAVDAVCGDSQTASYGRMDNAWPSLDGFLDPVDPVYVDGQYTGTERGTQSQPFEFLHRGVFGVVRGSTVNIAAGIYSDPMVIERAMTLRAYNGPVTIGQ